MKQFLNISVIISIFFSSALFAQTLQEFDLQEISEQQISLFVDHPNEAAYIFYTAINGLTVVSSTGGIVSSQQEATKLTVFLRPERQVLTLKAPGFIEKKIAVESISAKQAKFFRLNPREENYNPEKGNYEIKTIPTGCLLKIDGFPTFKQFTNFELKDFEVKKYRINLSKPDYFPLDTLIEIRQGIKQSSVFKLRSKFATLSLKAPATLSVKINGKSQDIGTEFVSQQYPEGSYVIEVNDLLFKPYKETLYLKGGETKVIDLPLLRKGTYTIDSDPSGSNLTISGLPDFKQKTPFELKGFDENKYSIHLKSPDYFDLDTTIEIRQGMNQNGLFKLRSKFGFLSLKAPLKVTAKINKETIEISTKFSDIRLPIGNQTIEINDPRFDSYKTTFQIESGKTKTLDLQLVKRIGFLKINYPDEFTFKVYDSLFTKKQGVQLFEFFEGNYQTTIKRVGFEALDYSFSIRKGEAVNWEPVFNPVLVQLKLDTEPEGASVVLLRNGEQQVLGFTPIDERIEAGEVEFLITKDGFKDYKFKRKIEEGKQLTRKIDLLNPESDLQKNVKIAYAGTVTDSDGNVYQTVKIGNQVWMAENLKTTKYRNGELISNVREETAWSNLTTGAYCNYNSTGNNADISGRLYNWYAVNDSRKIAPKGWHVATDAEWTTLITYVGGESVAGTKLKSKTGWNNNGSGTDDYGFTAFPDGYRNYDGTFYFVGNNGYWWSSTEDGSYGARLQFIGNSSNVFISNFNKSFGLSVRCVKD